jgi:hypothetical protein
MRQFIKHFYREGRGRWVCATSCKYSSPVGDIHVVTGTTVMRGLSFRSFDVAAALDGEYDRQEQDHS